MTVVPEVAWPDVELLVLGFLRSSLPGVRLVTDTPADMAGDVVQVTRIGGASDGLRIDTARVDIDCFAASRRGAADLALQVRGLLPTLRNQTVGGAVVVRVLEEVGPSWRPNLNSAVRRFGMTVQVMLRPA